MATIKKMASSIQCYTASNWWGESWREGLFCGNGVVGANVFGGAVNEKVLINHRDLMWQGRISVVPDMSAKMKEVKKLVENGEYDSAENSLQKAMIAKNFRPQPFSPLPLCLLKVKALSDKAVKDFSRSLNMANGEITVSYLDGATRMNRSLFVSRDNNTLVYEFTKSGAKQLDVEFSFDVMDAINARTPGGVCNMPEGVRVSYDKYFMFFSARNDNGSDYGAVARLNHYGGSMKQTDGGVRISGANSIILYLKVFVESNRDKEYQRLKADLAALKEPYDKLLKTSASLHSKLFNSSDITFGAEDGFTEDLLSGAAKGDLSPALVEKLWKYGRYLMICGCNEQGGLFSPYGLWNGSYKAYKAQLTFSGATQSCYRQALSGNLLSYAERLFDYIDARVNDYKDNALRLYDCRGIFVPSICATNTGRLGSIDPQVLHFTGCGAMLADLYYQYYLITGNSKFLKTRAMPFMLEAALFYEDFFKLGEDTYYVSCPSCLPLQAEKRMGDSTRAKISQNAAVDFAVSAQLLTDLIDAANETKLYLDEVPKWKEMLSKLPKAQVDENGVLKDFLGDNVVEENTSADNSVFYQLLTMNDRSKIDDEESFKNYSNSAKKKFSDTLDYQTSYGLLTLGIAFAKLSNKSAALECITNVIRGCAMGNLALAEKDWRGMGICGSGVWVPMQLQSNLTLTDLIQQMILQSTVKTIKILPCYPNEWGNVSVEKLLATNGCEVSVDLNMKSAQLSVEVRAKKNCKFDLYLPDGAKKMLKTNTKLAFDSEFLCVPSVELSANKTATFLFKYGK